MILSAHASVDNTVLDVYRCRGVLILRARDKLFANTMFMLMTTIRRRRRAGTCTAAALKTRYLSFRRGLIGRKRLLATLNVATAGGPGRMTPRRQRRGHDRSRVAAERKTIFSPKTYRPDKNTNVRSKPDE